MGRQLGPGRRGLSLSAERLKKHSARHFLTEAVYLARLHLLSAQGGFWQYKDQIWWKPVHQIIDLGDG